MASGDLGISTDPPIHSNMDGVDVRIAPPKQDKHALIKGDGTNIRERVPLKEAVIIQQEKICGYDGLRFIIITSLVFALAITVAMIISIISGQRQVDPHGAIATDVEECSDIGAKMLKQGGHAVDAAVAAAFCLGVVHGQYSGLGGGGFLLVANPLTNDVAGFDFREMAPARSSKNMFASNPRAPIQGGLSVAVPGKLRGLEAAWKKYGKLSWSALIEPSIELAENGFKVTPQLAADIASTDFSATSQSLRDLYQNRRANATLQRPTLANLLRNISLQGSDALYNGTMAQEIIDTVGGAGGILTRQDLQSYTAHQVSPLESSHDLHRIYSLPSPSSGPSVLASLHTMADLNISATFQNISALGYHQIIEISKFVAAMVRQLGDPLQTPESTNLTDSMLSDNTSERIRNAVNDSATFGFQHYFEGDIYQELYATQAVALVSVADENNNLVSLTSSIGSPFGSGLMTPSGVILNSAMNSFNWEGKDTKTNRIVPEANAISPGRRPMSNMAPFISWSKDSPCLARYVLTGVGTSSISSAAIDVAMKLLSQNSSLRNDVDRRDRIFPSLYENKLVVEGAVSPDIRRGLEDRGHVLETTTSRLGVVHVASEVKDKITAYSDSRRLGAQATVY